MPIIPNSNIGTPVVMIAEKCICLKPGKVGDKKHDYTSLQSLFAQVDYRCIHIIAHNNFRQMWDVR